jgi:hypothetical protein
MTSHDQNAAQADTNLGEQDFYVRRHWSWLRLVIADADVVRLAFHC